MIVKIFKKNSGIFIEKAIQGFSTYFKYKKSQKILILF
jgi:hypothetical protein